MQFILKIFNFDVIGIIRKGGKSTIYYYSIRVLSSKLVPVFKIAMADLLGYIAELINAEAFLYLKVVQFRRYWYHTKGRKEYYLRL